MLFNSREIFSVPYYMYNVLETSRKATCGEAKFEFQTTLVHEILQAIKTNISKAIELRKRRSCSSQDTRDRTMSMERGFQNLLTNSGRSSRSSSMASNVSATHSVSNSPTLSLKSALERTAVWRDKNDNCERLRCNSLNMGNNSSLEGSKESLSAHTRSHSLDAKSIKKSGFPHQYDILTLTKKENPDEKPEIVGKVCVQAENSSKPVEIMLDSHGYSHIPGKFKICPSNSNELNQEKAEHIQSSLKDECISKIESKELSSKIDVYLPVDSQDEKRSLSVGSHDSGVSCPSSYQPSTEERTHRNKESFDSAISYSEISVSIPEAIVVTDSNSSGFTRSFSHPHSMYLNEPKHERSNSEPTKTVASDEYANVESEYEDLDKYRKDLKKFLGMGDKPPEEVPPSLPERPSSLPPSRRVIKDSKRKRVSFTGFVQNRLSSSSDSDDAEHEVTALGSWPIRQNTGDNALYAKVERNETAVVKPKSDYDQNLYETIPAAVEEKEESPISPIKAWPLQRTAQANCNRFYESNDALTKQLPSPGEARLPSPTDAPSKQSQDVAGDFLTGDAPYISTKVIPVLSPSKPAPVLDLLSGDIPEQQTKKLAVLDVLLPFSMDDIKQWEREKAQGQDASCKKEDVQNPFPNIARYSGALESFSENTEMITSDYNSEKPEGCDAVTPEINDDPNNSLCAVKEEDLINFDETETLSNDQTTNLEDTYMPMEHKEPVYVEPSELQLKDQ